MFIGYKYSSFQKKKKKTRETKEVGKRLEGGVNFVVGISIVISIVSDNQKKNRPC